MRILKRLKQGYVNKKKIYGFDIETWHERSDVGIKQHFLMGSIVGDDFQRTFWDQDEMRSFLLSKPMRQSQIFATNLDFDFNMLFHESRYIFKKIIKDGSLIYAQYIKDKHYVEFLDTWNYTGKISVEKMGEQLKNYKKMVKPKAWKKDLTDEERDYLIEYNLADSMVTYEYARQIKEFFNFLGCRMKITISSAGQDNWRRYDQPQDLFQEKKEILDKHYEAGIHGGRCEVYMRGNVLPGIEKYYWDFNSSYPDSCMKGTDDKGSYPDPNTSRYLDGGSVDLIEQYEGISKIDIFVPYRKIPVLGVVKDGKYIFPYGSLSGWFTNVEIREAMIHGGKIKKVYEMIYYTGYFKPFVTIVPKLYALRRKFKEQDNEVFSNLVKVMMNGGLFGKFGQRMKGREDVYDEREVYVDNDRMLYVYKFGERHYLEAPRLSNGYIYDKVNIIEKYPVFIFPILASYTTALSRLKLFRKMSQNEDKMIYTDTDSLVTTESLYENSTDLGKLKLEYRFTEGIFVCPKLYMIDGNVKSKGVGKRMTRSDFERLRRKGIRYNHFIKMKESGVRKIPFATIQTIRKHMSFEDNKRAWPARYDGFMQCSEPLRIDMF